MEIVGTMSTSCVSVASRMTPKRAAVLAVLGVALLYGATPAVAVPAISVGTPFAGPPGTVVYPIEISGAVDLETWNFDLFFNPASLSIVETCDPSLDQYCNFGGAGVTEGPFTSSGGTHFTVFNPGFIDNTTGFLDDVLGAYADIAPGPSGDGVLAYVEFTTISTEEDPNVRIDDASVTSAVPEPATLGLLASGLALLGIRRVRGRRQIT